jgi:hypothetical protein
LRIAEKLEVLKVSAPSGTTNHGLDTVEVSAPSKTKKKKRKTARVGGTGIVEVPASAERVNVRWMRATSECETTRYSGKLTGNRSRRAGLKKGAGVAVGERKTEKKTPSRAKRRRCKNSIRRKGTGMHR